MLGAVVVEPLKAVTSLRSSSIHLSIAVAVVRTEKTRAKQRRLGAIFCRSHYSKPISERSVRVKISAYHPALMVRSAIANAAGTGSHLSSFVLPEKGGGGEDSEGGLAPMT